ncbi:hypothetical protein HPB50_016096 [Hyalomma asiaticum]|uniref:Uncharacterized protein n=1 Tax=Hyalomma asiaticum TaxID=266040 RepID=A0ACB7SWR3_HYAAI|nr:hypothetical protein HPB50_016096 [Hyalomma asiaticum]
MLRGTLTFCYHELPAKQQLRDAWLRHISRPGNVKGSQWVPNSRAIKFRVKDSTERSNHDDDREDPAILDAALALLWKLQHVMKHDEVPPHLEFAPLTYIARYLAFVCEQTVACRECKVRLKGSASRDGAYQFTFSLDQGGLSYPRPEVVWLCKLLCTFVESPRQSAKVYRCGKLCQLLHVRCSHTSRFAHSCGVPSVQTVITV